MLTFLMIVLGIVTVLMGLAILLQEPKQAGLSGAFGLGGSEQMLGTSPTSGIARFTVFLSVAFFLLCITVGLLAREDRDDSRLVPDPIEPGIGAVDPGAETGADGVIGLDESLPGNAAETDVVTEEGAASDAATDSAPAATEETETSTDGAPADDAPSAEDTPVENEPVTPASDAPAETPASDAPVETPAGDAPVETPGTDENTGAGN